MNCCHRRRSMLACWCQECLKVLFAGSVFIKICFGQRRNFNEVINLLLPAVYAIFTQPQSLVHVMWLTQTGHTDGGNETTVYELNVKKGQRVVSSTIIFDSVWKKVLMKCAFVWKYSKHHGSVSFPFEC